MEWHHELLHRKMSFPSKPRWLDSERVNPGTISFRSKYEISLRQAKGWQLAISKRTIQCKQERFIPDEVSPSLAVSVQANNELKRAFARESVRADKISQAIENQTRRRSRAVEKWEHRRTRGTTTPRNFVSSEGKQNEKRCRSEWPIVFQITEYAELHDENLTYHRIAGWVRSRVHWRVETLTVLRTHTATAISSARQVKIKD